MLSTNLPNGGEYLVRYVV